MSVDGNWDLVIESPIGKQYMLVAVTGGEGGALTGSMTNKSANKTTDIYDAALDGDQLTFKAKLQAMNMTLTFMMTVADDTMTGKVKAGLFGTFDVAGRR
jgi:hypothetical protein